MKFLCALTASISAFLLVPAVTVLSDSPTGQPKTPIKHFIVLMEEGRSFDSYFGTYPGSDGLAKAACVKLAKTPCARPVPADETGISPLDADDRKSTGLVTLSHYTDKHVPYLWNVADEYVLLDRYFSSSNANPDSANWNRMFWIAGVSGNVRRIPAQGYGDLPTIFDRLEERGVTWKFYVEDYDHTQTFRSIEAGKPVPGQIARVPLLGFARFVDDPKLAGRIVDLNEYYNDLKSNSLPSVSYIVAKGAGEKQFKSLLIGQRHLKAIMQELMRSSAWPSSALLWTHDQPNGWFDHVAAPQVDRSGLGPRVPAMLISPFVARGKVDSTILEHSSILRFIQENWKLRPLSRRDRIANSLITAFNFAQAPRPPVFLPMERANSAVAQAQNTNRSWIFVLYGLALTIALLAGGAVLRSTALGSKFSGAARATVLLIVFGAACIFGLTRLVYAAHVPTRVTINPVSPVVAGQPFTVTGSLHMLVQTGTVGIPGRQVKLYLETLPSSTNTGPVSPTILLASVFSDDAGNLSWVVRKPLSAGQYRLYYRYIGSNIFIEHQASTELSILSLPPKVAIKRAAAVPQPRVPTLLSTAISPVEIQIGDTVTIAVRLNQPSLAPIADQNLHLELPAVTLMGKTDATGYAIFVVKRPLQPGANVGRVWFDGTAGFSAVQQTLRINVQAPAQSTLTLAANSADPRYVGERHTVSARLLVDGQPLANRLIRFTIDGEARSSDLTDSAGRAVLKLPHDLPAGDHRIGAEFRGTQALLGASKLLPITLLPQPFAVKTVPAIASLRIQVGDQVILTDEQGVARLPIKKSGPVTVSVLPYESADKHTRAKFVRWSDGVTTASRSIHVNDGITFQAGIEVSRLIAQRYLEDQSGREVERSRLNKIVVVDSTGATMLIEGGHPKWLKTNRITRQGESLVSSNLTYYIQGVDVDGIDVVNSGQQRFEVTSLKPWIVRVQMHDVSVISQDALFGFKVGKSVRLVDPLGRAREIALASSGPTHIASLARGDYVITVQGALGILSPTPIALSRSQTLTLEVITYLDIAVVGLLGLTIAVLALLIGRAGLLTIVKHRLSARWPLARIGDR